MMHAGAADRKFAFVGSSGASKARKKFMQETSGDGYPQGRADLKSNSFCGLFSI